MLSTSTHLVRMSSTLSPARVAVVTAPGLAQYSRPLLGSTATEVTPSTTPATTTALHPVARLVTWIARLALGENMIRMKLGQFPFSKQYFK